MSTSLTVTKIKQAVLDMMRVAKHRPFIPPSFRTDPPPSNPLYSNVSKKPIDANIFAIPSKRSMCVSVPPSATMSGSFLDMWGHKTTVLASLLMAFYYCVDDCCFQPRSLAEYGSRLVSGSPQLEKGLDDLTALNSELSNLYAPVIGDLLRMSHQAYMMGNHLEVAMEGVGTKVGNNIHKS
ncbi:hypothetical protein C8J57DRAFT_1225647 [Mycena rebaudengoi]|nr:hypothetical protein C8J57DRAFT_1225647 [Mycena rebaudengoi]